LYEEDLKRIREDLDRTRRELALLSEEKQIPHRTRLYELERAEADLLDKMKRADIIIEVEKLKSEMTGSVEKLQGVVGALSTEIKVVAPQQIDDMRHLVAEIGEVVQGLLMPFHYRVKKEITERTLWYHRIARGEAVVERRIEGKYAVYETYHHLPTCERWVRTSARKK